MGEFFKAELKDRFLKYALERRDYFETQVLYDEFLRPNYDLGFVEKLIQDIQTYDTSLLDIMGGNGSAIFMLASTSTTQRFLDDGGFKEMYVKEEEKWDTLLEQISTRSQKKEGKERLSPKSSDQSKREKTLLILLITAIGISFLFTLFSILYSTLLKPEYVPADEFERKLELLNSQHEQEMELLSKELEENKKLVDSLVKKTRPQI